MYSLEEMKEQDIYLDHAECIYYRDLVFRLLTGNPIELTDASYAVGLLRQQLEGDCIVVFGGEALDLGGEIYWSKDGSTALYFGRA